MTTEDAAERLENVRRRVIAVVGHALRTPVTTVRGLAGVVRASEGVAPDEVTEALARETRILEELVDDLLVVSDVTTVLPVRTPRTIPIGEAVGRVWSAICADAPDGDAQIDRLVVEQDASVLVGGDAINWILRHVLRNALLYADGAVVVSGQQLDGETRVEMRSSEARCTGEDAKNALELFYRGEDAVTSSSGLGIGLPVAALIAKHAGGGLDVRLEGETFIVDLRLPAG
jgi:two-component system, OmpR family, sensor histidine kinase BaeS